MTEQVAVASPATDNSTVSDAQAPAPEKLQDVKPSAEAPSAPAGDKAPSAFDAVKAALNKDTKPAEAPPASEAKKDTPESPDPVDDDEKPDTGELSDDDKKSLSTRTQERIRNLARQVKEFKEPAERAARIDSFLQRNGMSPNDAADALDIAALLKTNPPEGLKKLRELAYQVSLSLGETLPPDVAEKVKSGVIDEATGRELAVARAKANGFQQMAEASAEQQAVERQKRLQSDVTNAVNTWEAGMTTRDADFARKKPLIEREFRALLQEGHRIQSPEDSVRLMKDAYKRVSDNLRAFVPAKPAISPTSATPTAAPTKPPASYEDAVFAAFGRQRAA